MFHFFKQKPEEIGSLSEQRSLINRARDHRQFEMKKQSSLNFFDAHETLLVEASITNMEEITLKELLTRVKKLLTIAEPFVINDQHSRLGLGSGQDGYRIREIIAGYSGVNVLQFGL